MDYFDEEKALTTEELTELRIERYIDREMLHLAAAVLFTIMVFGVGSTSGADTRVWMSGIAGAFFLMAGFNRLLRNFAIARRG